MRLPIRVSDKGWPSPMIVDADDNVIAVCPSSNGKALARARARSIVEAVNAAGNAAWGQDRRRAIVSEHLDQTAGLPMFAGPRARNSDPQTSHDAADSMIKESAHQRDRCVALLLKHGPMTADKIDEFAGWRITTAGRRLPELHEQGRVRRTTRKEKTRSGRSAFVWELR